MNKHILLSLLSASLLAACGSRTTTPALEMSSTPIPLVQSQSLVLATVMADHSLNSQTAQTTQADSVLVEDFDGNPFYYLTVVGNTGNSASFWDAVDVQDAGAVVYGTGASQDRNLYAFEFGSEYIRLLGALHHNVNISRLVSPQAQMIWAEDDTHQYWDVSTGLKVLPKDVEMFRTLYGQMKADYLSKPDDVAVMHSAWTDSEQALSTAAVKPAAITDQDGNLDFAKAFRAAGVSAQANSSGDPSSWGWFGWINARAGIAGTDLNGADAMAYSAYLRGMSLAVPNNAIIGASSVVYDASIPLEARTKLKPFADRYMADLTNMAQASQNAPFMQTLPDGFLDWGMQNINPALAGYRSGNESSIIGCVPTSFIRILKINALYGANAPKIQKKLVQRYYTDPTGQYAASFVAAYKDAAIQKFLVELTRPVQADGYYVPANYAEPYASKIFGAGALYSGTSVTASGMVMGTNQIASEFFPNSAYRVGGMRASLLGLTLPLASTYTHNGVSFDDFTYIIRDAVRNVINDDNSAITFSYIPSQTGTASVDTAGHNAVSYAYRVYEHVGYSDVFLFLTNDTEGVYNGTSSASTNGWINVTNRWSTTQGAAGFRFN